ncbi:MAG: hypothetical protein O2917_06700 [Acidobacteria bacterium]|nr:hypothetical protein [Acidobacteriota bacterium]
MLEALKRMGGQKPGPQTDNQDPVLLEVRREKAEVTAMFERVTAEIGRLEEATRTAAAAAEADAQKQRQVTQ